MKKKGLKKTLEKLHHYLSSQTYSWEVVVVNDGSTDKTGLAVENLIKNWPEFRLIEYSPNRGKGGAIKTGMLEAKGQWRLFMDADNSTDIKEIEKLLPYRNQFEVIIGSRYLKRDSIKVKQPIKRRIISRVSNFFIRLVIGLKFKDTQCGFKLFSGQATEKIFLLQTINHWSFDIELLVIAKKLGFPIKEVAIDWYDSRGSKINKLPVTEAVVETLRIYRNNLKGLYKSD